MPKKKEDTGYLKIRDSLSVLQINRDEADSWLKKLDAEGGDLRYNFEIAFHAERGRKYKKETIWGLPPDEMTYYMVYRDRDAVLIAGINQNHDICAFAKVTNKKEFKSKGKYCVKKLIEDVLVPRCKVAAVNTSRAYAYTQRSIHIFEYLMGNLPKGINQIETSGDVFALYVS